MVNKQMMQRMGYALGAFGHDTYYVALNTYFMIFVTSVMFAGSGKNMATLIGLVTTLVVTVRLVEIIFDPLIGSVIDNTESRYGKFKPWLVGGGLVSGALLIVIFTNMFGLALKNETLFITLFTIGFIILDSFYSFKDIAFWSMIPALSTDTKEREKLGTFARFGSSLGANGTTMLVVPITTTITLWLTGKNEQGAVGWFWFAVIVAVISAGTAIITALTTHENMSIIRQQTQKAQLRDIFKALAKNDQLLWLGLSYIAYAIANVATTGVLLLFYKFVLGRADLFVVVGVIATVTGLIAVPLFPVLTKIMSRRLIYLGGLVLNLVAYGLFMFAHSNLMLVQIATVCFYFPQQLIFLSALLTITDSVEYGQLKNGVRNEAVTLSIRPLLDKIAGALSNGIVGFIAVAAGMSGTATYHDITAANVGTFTVFAFALPAILMVFAGVIFAWKVRLFEAQHAQIVQQLELQLHQQQTTTEKEV
ncbi:Lactose permease [Periweissella fabaria]|uniref:Lactose permease n=1 Tax=Periweissella fabaria TaxID=546157 RepID=A0ABM8Z3V5_9LACO|nr:glycoside-pentoside-hexuronide (GPH):cation symporter [Periweissella fabaria]CAH0415864.1 Lactose permease [Periweissella fabaria]